MKKSLSRRWQAMDEIQNDLRLWLVIDDTGQGQSSQVGACNFGRALQNLLPAQPSLCIKSFALCQNMFFVMQIDKHDLARELNLPFRDLRAVDPEVITKLSCCSCDLLNS